MKRFRNKLIIWLILKLDIDITTDDSLVVSASSVVQAFLKLMVESYASHKEFDRDISKMSFIAKYHEFVDDPYEKLQEFYVLAGKGDNSFLSDPFYRRMRVIGDKQIVKLNHRLRRNTR